MSAGLLQVSASKKIVCQLEVVVDVEGFSKQKTPLGPKIDESKDWYALL